MDHNKIKILLVEDDETLRFIVQDNLEQNNYSVYPAEDGEIALTQFLSQSFDLIILDVMLPKKDGFTVAREIRQHNQQVPIIFLTARSMTEDKIKGLTIGGDDYIPKPFSMEELLLKIKIFLRRSQTQASTDSKEKEIQLGSFKFNPENLSLTSDESTRTLTMKEAELLHFFARNRNKVLSRNEILKAVWGNDDYFLGRSLDVFISRLRKYLKPDPSISIVNLHGVGFRFSVKDS